jgi:hypothetical protein
LVGAELVMPTQTEAVHSSLQPNGERERERESICTTDSERSMRVQPEPQEKATGKSNRNRFSFALKVSKDCFQFSNNAHHHLTIEFTRPNY